MRTTACIEPPGRELDRIWDNRLETNLVRLMPGDYFISARGDVASTVLGSCIAACIRDADAGVGGMNHFMLPDSDQGARSDTDEAARYGIHAMEFLIAGIERLGGRRDRMEIKLFGGGRIVDGMTDVGQRNIDFVRQYVDRLGLSPAAEDLGLSFPRKVNYFTDSGRVMVKKLRALHSRSVAADEQQYCAGIQARPAAVVGQ